MLKKYDTLYMLVKDEVGFNFLAPTRKREYVEARALYIHILLNYHGLGYSQVATIIRHIGGKFGLKYDHSKVIHAEKMWSVYRRFNKDLDKTLNILLPKLGIGDKQVEKLFIKERVEEFDDSKIDKVMELVSDLYLKDVKVITEKV